MIIKKIPEGTRIYLTKKKPYILYIQPDKTLINDNLYVAYDVRIDGRTIIPKGTRVVGDWVTESFPSIAAQLQVSRIYLQGAERQFIADSDIIETVSNYNNSEVSNANYFHKKNNYASTSNINRRIANVKCCVRTLLDNNPDTPYLEIDTQEIPVTVIQDFIAFPTLH
jgi:hypothetical protein